MCLPRIFTSSFFLFLSFFIFAQKPPIKFGKVSNEELEMKVYEKDSSAGAVVLFDFGVSKIEYVQNTGFVLILERTRRIKIFDKKEYDRANIEVYLYNDGGDKEKLSGLKGYTHNLENGKIVSNKLNKQSIFEEELDKNHDVTKFTLPNVKEGSVIEYTYRITSNFLFNFNDWVFQSTIPIMWSEYITVIPEYYHYQRISQGYLPFHISTSEQKTASIMLTSKSRTGHSVSKSQITTEKIDLFKTYSRLVVKDAPAFKSEPYMSTYKNYISKITHELSYKKFPNRAIENVMGDWNELNKKYLESSYFGQKLKMFLALNKVVDELTEGIENPLEKAQIIYNHVLKKVAWNGKYRRMLDATLGKAYDTGFGSSSQINLLLTNMLLKAGLIADPVLISTRNHGIVRTQYPIADQFNYVISKLTIGDKYFLLDATNKYTPFGVLPQRCLNGQGRVISKENAGWINLETKARSGDKISGKIKISDEGGLVGSLKLEHKGYNAYAERKKYFSQGEEEFLENKKANSDWEYESYNLEQQDNISASFIENFEFEAETDLLGNMLYINPIITGKMDKNPFTLEKRTYPVDFTSPISNLYYVTFEIPEGYVVEEKPVSLAIGLPNSAAKFIYQVTENEKNITIMSKLDLTKTLFIPDEYEYLKAFYAQMVAKQNEQIVLKKQ